MSWAFTEGKIRRKIEDVRAGLVRDTLPLANLRVCTDELDYREAPSPNYDDSSWPALGATLAWGSKPEVTVWLRSTVVIPQSWKGDRVVARLVPQDCEILAYVDGKAIQAIDGEHHELILADAANGGERIVLALEAYSGLASTGSANPYFGSEPSADHRLIEAVVWRVDVETYRLAFDLKFAFDVAQTLDKSTREYSVIIATIEEAVDYLDFRTGRTSDSFYESVRIAGRTIRSKLLEAFSASVLAPTLWSTGHAHIDTAWLWRLAHTRKKCVRTFTTMLELMRRYPEYVFTCSQPQQYEYIKEDRPELFAQIKEAVRQGNWEPVGGMWVESDCNVVSGESLVRQFLYGQSYFEREFGTRTNVVWLPDVFGYSAAFPQIIRKCGMKYFMTIKIFWNQVNKPPYQSFRWFGIDGTDVLVHFSPLGDYNAQMTPAQWSQLWKQYDQRHITTSSLYIFGHGDGGGGPTYQMLEYAERARDFLGTPKIQLSDTESFFDDLDRQFSEHRNAPTWRGELYLEYHRGTYTSQGRNKKNNRQSEILYQTAEQAASLARLVAGFTYPQRELTSGWQTILLNQFHDIIPGSSIHEVYLDSDKDYARVAETGNAVASNALDAVAANVPGNGLFVYNPLSWARDDIAVLPAECATVGQPVRDFDGAEKIVVELDRQAPALGYARLSPPVFADNTLTASTKLLESRFFKITLDDAGEIESLLDKRTGRQVIDQDSYCLGNALLSFEDKPMNWDAWDIDLFYQDKMYPVQEVAEIKAIETGPIRATVEISRTLSRGRGSAIRQRISIYRNLPRIDFDTLVDWKERQTLLKVAFPVNINSLRATYDIQFGHIERSTHWNTSWDWARFEVCGHKWADLSEGGYGVSLLSDSKYGWDIKDNVMRLTLLKSATHPDPEADQGVHRFVYSLYPHEGNWRDAGTVRRAYELNVPIKTSLVKASTQAALPSTFSLVSVDQPNLIIETVKKAEAGDGHMVRLYEAFNERGIATLTFGRDVTSAKSVNLLEDEADGDEPEVTGNQVRFSYRPFDIRTFSVVLA